MGKINWEKRTFGADYLRKILFYGISTGYFFWLIDKSGTAMAGSRAGTLNPRTGYWEIKIDGNVYMASNLAWLWVVGEWPPIEVDHKNRHPSEDRWDNLRLATHSQQMMNRKLHSNNTHGVKGVYRSGNRWEARISVENKNIQIGSYKTFEEAVAARRTAEIKYHGEFAPSYAAE
jgi:hypothetical protein